MDRAAQYTKVFSKYLPAEFVDLAVKLLLQHSVIFKIVKPRKTKLGDFRAGLRGEKHQITVNGDLSPYSFLITTLHEFAHLVTYELHGRRAAPHGEEWKHEYRKLLLPVIQSGHLPADIEKVLMNSLIRVKAASCSDQKLQRVLMRYDVKTEPSPTLESLEKNSTFALNGKTFVKGKLRRTRFLCTDTETNRQYLVNALARVTEIKHGK